MECRRSFLVALGLSGGVLGCAIPGKLEFSEPPRGLVQINKSSPAANEAKRPPQAAEAKRPPQAATCVALGRFREEEAREPNRTPAQRELLIDEARRSYQHALEIDPHHVPAYQALGRYYMALGSLDRALQTYRKGLELHPAEAILHYDLGMCLGRMKQWEAALRSLRKAQELDPENRAYAITLGYGLARTGHHDESLFWLEKVFGPAQAHYKLARMMLHLNEAEQARQHLQQAVQADPELKDAQELLARLNTPGTGAVTVGFEAAEEEQPPAPEPPQR